MCAIASAVPLYHQWLRSMPQLEGSSADCRQGLLQVLPLLRLEKGAVLAPEVALDMHPAPARDTHFDDSSSGQHKSGVPDTESAGGDGSQEATEDCLCSRKHSSKICRHSQRTANKMHNLAMLALLLAGLGCASCWQSSGCACRSRTSACGMSFGR